MSDLTPQQLHSMSKAEKRRLMNRESAYKSRKAKRMKLQRLESQNQVLMARIAQLERENARLRGEVTTETNVPLRGDGKTSVLPKPSLARSKSLEEFLEYHGESKSTDDVVGIFETLQKSRIAVAAY